MGKPTHNLVAKRIGQDYGSRVGVAWKNDSGSISIRLSPCVVISHNDDIYLTLFPADNQNSGSKYHDSGEDIKDDDIPF